MRTGGRERTPADRDEGQNVSQPPADSSERRRARWARDGDAVRHADQSSHRGPLTRRL